MKYVTYQANDHDCGFVALKMLLATLSKNKSYLYLPKDGKIRNFSFTDLIKIGKEHGLVLKAYEDEDKDVGFVTKSPALLLLNDNKTYNNHLVMVWKLRRGKVYFNDPSVGEVVMKEEEFLDLFTGKYLQVDSCQIEPYQAKEFKVTRYTQTIPILLINILSIVFLLTGLFFVKKDEYVFIPLIFLALFSISELVENWYYINLLKQFDIAYLEDYMHFSKDRVNDYKEYSKFKLLSFSKSRNIYTSITISVSILIVLIINDTVNVFPILLLMTLACIDFLITRKTFNKERISQEENSIMFRTKADDLSQNLLAFNERTNKIAFNLSFKKCLITFLTLFMAFLMMIINHLVSSNYIIFNFAAYYFLYEQFGRILDYEPQRLEYLKAKERFVEVIALSKGKQNVL